MPVRRCFPTSSKRVDVRHAIRTTTAPLQTPYGQHASGSSFPASMRSRAVCRREGEGLSAPRLSGGTGSSLLPAERQAAALTSGHGTGVAPAGPAKSATRTERRSVPCFMVRPRSSSEAGSRILARATEGREWSLKLESRQRRRGRQSCEDMLSAGKNDREGDDEEEGATSAGTPDSEASRHP